LKNKLKTTTTADLSITAAAYLKKVPKGLFSVKPDSSVELNLPLDRNMIKQDKPQNKTCVAAVASNVPT
jgi:hypothetical protein